MVRLYSRFKVEQLLGLSSLSGSSPPGVFIGRIGYPYVSIGPLVPPTSGDTGILDTPEFWLGKTIDEIVDFRATLVRGKHRVHVMNVDAGGKICDIVRELALASSPTDVEVEFLKKPRANLILNDELQPFGPSAPLKNISVGSFRIDNRIEKAYSDSDLKASEAVLSLYDRGVLVSRIQKAFSVGAFGIKGQRRFVPTRWSITAVDSLISNSLLEAVKKYPLINDYRVYESGYLDNRFEIVMMPESWSYESMEAWYPGTAWNQRSHSPVILSDWEGFKGRTTYAAIGGCYYAARLAVAELLSRERRQAEVLVLREVHPGYIMPVGVWQVRENVRNAMRQHPHKFNTLYETLSHISSKLSIGIEKWIQASALLQRAIKQRKITEYTAKHSAIS